MLLFSFESINLAAIDWATIASALAALFSAGAALFSAITTFKTNKIQEKLKQEQLNFEEKWRQRQINSNYFMQIVNPRIQKSKELFSELFDIYLNLSNKSFYIYKGDGDETEFKNLLNKAKEKTRLLILEFNPDPHPVQIHANNEKFEILLNEKNNDKKDKLIVDFLEEVLSEFSASYYFYIWGRMRDTKEEISNLESELERISNKDYDNPKDRTYRYTFYDEEIGKYWEYIKPNEYEKYIIEDLVNAEKKLKEYEDKEKKINNKLKLLKNILLIYWYVEQKNAFNDE